MKRNTTVITGPGAAQGMQPTAGPSVAYTETRTYILTDEKGNVSRYVSEVPLKVTPIDAEEVDRMRQDIVASGTVRQEPCDREDPKQYLRKQNTQRFDDDGAAWL